MLWRPCSVAASLVVTFTLSCFCRLPATFAQALGGAEDPGDIAPLRFELFDAFGREVRSDDYLGAPVLIMAGACWCGGCQQDAEPLRLVAEEYGPRGLRVIRSVAGDDELAALEFQKHYRLPFVQLLDPVREFEKQYNEDGWTFLMIADKEGQVVYRVNNPNWSQVRKVLDGVVAESEPARGASLEGVAYPPATLARGGETDGPARRDRFPSVACGADGRVYVALTSNRNGTSDVFLRVFDGEQWSDDRPVAATEADEYDGAVVVDRQDRVWVSWTSSAGSDKYNIFVACLPDAEQPARPTQITDAEDDAAHGRMACDEEGCIWVTYYKWRKMSGRSRDREVYLRRFDGHGWSGELHVSPTDVPEYEDHCDPNITPMGDSVVVCWVWDFHRPPGYTQASRDPTVFLRKVSPALELGPIRAVSGAHIDAMPTIAALPDGAICCAWESLVYQRRGGGGLRGYAITSRLCAGTVDMEAAEQPGPGTNVTSPLAVFRELKSWEPLPAWVCDCFLRALENASLWEKSLAILAESGRHAILQRPIMAKVELSGTTKNVCTPRLAVGPDGITVLVWSESNAPGRWELKSAMLNRETDRWSPPETLLSEGNPRFPATAFDAQGRLWIAYSAETEIGRQIRTIVKQPK